VESNLTNLQKKIFENLKNVHDFIAFPMDKEPGPVILKCSEYINRALKDHLNDPKTYKYLPEAKTTIKIEAHKHTVGSFFEDYNKLFNKKDETYLY
jgi:hypothetical protein